MQNVYWLEYVTVSKESQCALWLAQMSGVITKIRQMIRYFLFVLAL